MRYPGWVEIAAVIGLTVVLAAVAPDMTPRRPVTSAPGPSLLRPAVAETFRQPVTTPSRP
jgi:hypothetical protein